MCGKLSELEAKKLKYVTGGDININLLATNNTRVTNHKNNLTAAGCKMPITNHTRFADNCIPSLLDHIYTNVTKKDKNDSGVMLFEISDHLPLFYLVRNSKLSIKYNLEQNTNDT